MGNSNPGTKGDPLTTKQKKDGEGNAPVALGRVLEEQIAGWIGRVERTGHWKRRSDIHQRLMAEVEKIVIRAALEKTEFRADRRRRFPRHQPQHARQEDPRLRHPPGVKP